MKRAFTLIELVTAIAILVILIAISSIGINRARQASRDGQRVSDVLNYGRAIDQFSTTHGGAYPSKASGPSAQFCADQLDPSLLSQAGFSKGFPKDPQAFQSSANCTSYLNGYTYSTEYQNNGCSTSNLAVCLQVSYTLEVGLEQQQSANQQSLRTPSELNANSSNYPDSNSSRYDYVLAGPYCGSSCSKL